MADDRHVRTLDGDDVPVKTPSADLAGACVGTLAAAIVDVSRALAQSVPPPRGAPFFYLDVDAAYDLGALGSFWARGIFRKYEFALDLGSRLGGRARWLAARSGCRILGIDPCPAMVAAASMLNRRAQMDGQVAFQPGRLEALPLRGRVFTHVWLTDLAEGARSLPTFAEAFRVVRPGGHVALQSPIAEAGVHQELVEMLRRVGFVELEVREIAFAEPPPPWRLARDRLRTFAPDFSQAHAALRAPSGVQIFGRRPA